MKRKLVTLSALFVILAVVTSALSACSVSYRNDLDADEICAVIIDNGKIKGDVTKADEMFLEFRMDIEEGLYSDYAVYTADGLQQFGVFKVASPEKLESMKTALSDYVEIVASDSINLSYYTPEEQLAATNCKVLTYGDYVMFLMIDDTARSATESAIESLLKK